MKKRRDMQLLYVADEAIIEEQSVCRKKLQKEKKTLEGESPLLKDGALSLQTSLSHRELPPCPRHLRSEDLFRFLWWRGLVGKFLVWAGGANLLQSAASRPFCGRDLGTRVWHYTVGNDPCAVPFRLKVTCCSGLCLWWVEIYPPSSVAYATASPQGEAFCTLCEHGKYDFALWIAFAIRPHHLVV